MSLIDSPSEDHRSEHYLHALQLVAETSGALLVKDATTPVFWQKLGEAAAKLMSMEMVCVGVLDDGGTSLRYLSSIGVTPSVLGTTQSLENLPTSRQCLEERRTIAISDYRTLDESKINKSILSVYPIRAILLVPL